MGTKHAVRIPRCLCLVLIAFATRSAIADDSDTEEEPAARDAIEFCDRIQYAGIAVREPEHHVWGCSPVKDGHGKYHLFGARFGNPFKTAWRSDSHVVHYVSDTPQGPFTFVEYALFLIANSKKGGNTQIISFSRY